MLYLVGSRQCLEVPSVTSLVGGRSRRGEALDSYQCAGPDSESASTVLQFCRDSMARQGRKRESSSSSLCARHEITARPSRPALQPHLQLPLLLQHLELQPLDAVLQRLLALPHHLGPQRGLPLELPPSLRRRRGGASWSSLARSSGAVSLVRRPRQPPRVELRARLERLDPPRLPLQVLVRAPEQELDEGPDLVAQRGLGRRERGLRDELVVLSPPPPTTSQYNLK